MFKHVNVSSSESRFVKSVKYSSPDNSEDDISGLHNNTIAPVLVRAHFPPRVFGSKLLKDCNVKEHDVADTLTLSGLDYTVRPLKINNHDPAIPSPPSFHVDTSTSDRNNAMTHKYENIADDPYWPNVHRPVFLQN